MSKSVLCYFCSDTIQQNFGFIIKRKRIIINTIQELEEQRPGRNKNTTINHTYIDSGEYRRKFDCLSAEPKLNRLLYQLAKEMLNHRSGTLYEDMYWVDLDTFEVVAKETNSSTEEGIIYSSKTEKVIKAHDNLLTIHSHPNSFPPSISDFNSNFEHGYTIGVVVCHDGTIYMYSSEKYIRPEYYEMAVEDYQKNWYNIYDAQICAIEDLKKDFPIKFKEVTGNDV